LRIVLLIDEEMFDPDDPGFSNHKPQRYFDAEFHVSVALRRMGHKIVAVSAKADLAEILARVKAFRPGLVFNLVEHVDGDRANDSLVAAMLEVSQIPYTGAPPSALTIARDKHLSKLVVAAAGVRVPHSFVLNDRPPQSDRLHFPMIVKPLNLDGSEGIAAASYVKNGPELRRKIERWRKQPAQQMICEEYIDGRELIVTASGVDTVSIDSIRELVFPPTASIRFATERVKFDQNYRRRQGIHSRASNRFVASLNGKLERAARDAYNALGIKSYAKLEFRVRGGEVVFLEANPNSTLSRKSATTDFASIGYERFIRKIMRMAFMRHASRAAQS
jgi:D-alanine-D-alanine ligase